MNSWERAEDIYKRIKRHETETDRIASIQSFMQNEYGKGVRDTVEKIRTAKPVFGADLIDELLNYIKE